MEMNHRDRYDKFMSVGQLYEMLPAILQDSDLSLTFEDLDLITNLDDLNIVDESYLLELDIERIKLEQFLDSQGGKEERE